MGRPHNPKHQRKLQEKVNYKSKLEATLMTILFSIKIDEMEDEDPYYTLDVIEGYIMDKLKELDVNGNSLLSRLTSISKEHLDELID